MMKLIVVLGFALCATGALVHFVPAVANTVALGGFSVGGTILALIAFFALGFHWAHGK